MAGKPTLATLVLVVVAAAALMEGAAAAVYVVGDATSWTIPSSASFYSTWAANHTFAVGDMLVFNFVTGAHDVAKVTKTSYDSCSSASPISLQSTGPANVNLTTSGEHYFICTVGQHCANGQKLSVNVAAAGSPTPTPSPSPASPTPSPTPTPSTTPSPTPSATPAPAPTPAAPTPSPTAHSPPPSSAPTNSPPPPPGTESPPPSSSTPPTESTSPPPPPPSSAPHKAVAAFGMVVMSVAIGALF